MYKSLSAAIALAFLVAGAAFAKLATKVPVNGTLDGKPIKVYKDLDTANFFFRVGVSPKTGAWLTRNLNFAKGKYSRTNARGLFNPATERGVRGFNWGSSEKINEFGISLTDEVVASSLNNDGNLVADKLTVMRDKQLEEFNAMLEKYNANNKNTTLVQVPVPNGGGAANVAVVGKTSDADYPKMLQGVKDAVKAIVAAGFKLPAGITIYLANRASGDGANKVWQIAYNPPVGHKVFLVAPAMLDPNPAARGTERVVTGGAGTKGERGVAHTLGTKQGAAAAVHELGHVLSKVQDENTFFALMLTKDVNADNDGGKISRRNSGDAAAEVSQYAGKSKVEYVPEVFTGLVFGKSYSANAMAAYKSLGGPMTPAWNTKLTKKFPELAGY